MFTGKSNAEKVGILPPAAIPLLIKGNWTGSK
jgi:hypothetical protein